MRPPEKDKRMIGRQAIFDWTRFAMIAIIAIFAYFNYSWMIGYTMMLFNEPLEDMSHGWVIPFVSLYAIWKTRADFSRAMAIGRPSW